MMKFFKALTAVCCVVVCAMALSSCGNEMYSTSYTLGVTQFSSSGSSDLIKIQEYLESKGCPAKGDSLTWSCVDISVDKCDQQAAAHFKELTKDLSYSEVEALVNADCKFVYTITRSLDPADPTSMIINFGKWEYPKPKKK